jgi:hypothetical protein
LSASAPAADHHSHTAAATSKAAGRRDRILASSLAAASWESFSVVGWVRL